MSAATPAPAKKKIALIPSRIGPMSLSSYSTAFHVLAISSCGLAFIHRLSTHPGLRTFTFPLPREGCIAR
jgi:hypothetical protein